MSKLKKNTNHTKFPLNNPYRIGKLALIPLIIAIAIIPLIVKMKVYNSGLSKLNWFPSKDQEIDFFLYYKSLSFTLISIILAVILIWNYINHRYINPKNASLLKEDGKYKFNFGFIPLIVYASLALLSTIFSQYSSFGFTGIFEQFESVFVLLGYCLITYYSFLVIRSEDGIKFIMKWLVISSLILSFLGVTQAMGHDFLATTIGRKLIIPAQYWNILDKLQFNFEKNRVFLTLYNPNYVGSYVALIAPIFFVLLLFTKSAKLKILYSIAVLGLLLSLIGSSSRAGLIALLVCVFFILLLFRKSVQKRWKLAICIGVVGIAAIIALNAFTGNNFLHRFQNISTESKAPGHALTSIITNDDNVEVTYNQSKLYIQLDVTDENTVNLRLTDDNNERIQTNYDETIATYLIEDSRFSTLRLQILQLDDIFGLNVVIDGTNWIFTNQTEDNTYYYLNGYGKYDKILESESIGFDNYQSLGSGRGYLWSKTIPLLKKYILLGSGADTFSLIFPQNDYVGKFHWIDGNSIITKPHNMYLQIGIQTGVLSLIAFLTFYTLYFITCVKLYFKNSFDTYMSQIGVAIFIGTIGYMIAGIFNDSTITVSPVFWTLIGIGLATNYKVGKKILIDN